MLTEDQKKEIIKLRSGGLSISELSRRFKVHRKTIHYHLKDPMKPVQQRGKYTKTETKAYKNVLESYRNGKSKEKGKTYKDYVREQNRKFIRNDIGEIIRIENE